MTPKEYKEQAIKTLKPHQSKELAIADWALGLGGELGEFVDEALNIKQSLNAGVQLTGDQLMSAAKEAGDILWYAFALSTELDLKLENRLSDNWNGPDMIASPKNMYVALCFAQVKISQVLEMCKHAIAHKEKFTKIQMVQAIEGALDYLIQVFSYLHISIADVAELNVAKLAHRYSAQTFSHEESHKRHEREAEFTETEIYRDLYKRITGTK